MALVFTFLALASRLSVFLFWPASPFDEQFPVLHRIVKPTFRFRPKAVVGVEIQFFLTSPPKDPLIFFPELEEALPVQKDSAETVAAQSGRLELYLGFCDHLLASDEG